tara:strand:+ start:1666 stop:2739 length:1074 start_codon:yes stop_codon:yes gene_type:complete
MSFLNGTLLNDLQSDQATNEKRFSPLGVIDSVKASTASADYIPPSVRAALSSTSSLRDAEIPVIKDQTVTVVTTPGFEYIPSNLPDTDKYWFQPFDVFSGMRHYPAANDNNMVDSEYQSREVLKNVLYAMGNTVEGILLTQLDARKTQVLGSTEQVSATTGDYAFDATPDILKIKKAAQEETMFYSLEALMAANELGGNYRIVNNRAGLARQKAEALKFGAGNDKNLQALGFFGADRMYESGNITSAVKFDGYMFRDGAIGIFENFPSDFRNGVSFAGKSWSVSDMDLPFVNMRANIYTDSQATNATSLITSGTDSNLIMTHFEEMAVWVRFYVVYRYNSDLSTRSNDIVKVQGLLT